MGHLRVVGLLLVIAAHAAGQRPGLMDPTKAREKAPEQFFVTLSTSKGYAILEVRREWAPHGADRFYNLVKVGFFNECRFFRVIDRFMAQWGIPKDPAVAKAWSNATIPDDKVVLSNVRGALSFGATGQPNSRTTHIFVNWEDNSRLDAMGFAPFAKVVEGMDVLRSLHSGYGEAAPAGKGPVQSRINAEGNAYLEREFPKLDYIIGAGLFPPVYAGLDLATVKKIRETRGRLGDLYRLLMIYDINKKRWPRKSGGEFLLALLEVGILERNEKSCLVFFDAFSGRTPAADLSNVTTAGIDFTGPLVSGGRRYSPAMRNANQMAIAAQKTGPDGAAPCDGHGICVLYASGRVEFIPTKAFKGGKVVLGRKSPLKRLRTLVPAER